MSGTAGSEAVVQVCNKPIYRRRGPFLFGTLKGPGHDLRGGWMSAINSSAWNGRCMIGLIVCLTTVSLSLDPNGRMNLTFSFRKIEQLLAYIFIKRKELLMLKHHYKSSA